MRAGLTAVENAGPFRPRAGGAGAAEIATTDKRIGDARFRASGGRGLRGPLGLVLAGGEMGDHLVPLLRRRLGPVHDQAERGDLDAVAAALLGAIERLIGLREQRLDVEQP